MEIVREAKNVKRQTSNVSRQTSVVSRGEADGEHWPAVPGLRVGELMEAFTGWMRVDVADGNPSPLTLRCYAADVRQHLGWLADQGLTVVDVDEELLKSFRSGMIEDGYAVSTVARKLAAVRRFYELATARGTLQRNPAVRVRSPRERTNHIERVKYLTVDGIKALLSAPSRSPRGLRDKAMLVLMAMHGLRVAEVARLQIQDVELDAEEAGVVHVLGKGSKRRSILLTPETRFILKMWLQARSLMQLPHEAFFVGMAWNGSQGPLSTRGIRHVVDGYLEALGLKRAGISCHSLRHSFATQALYYGADLYAISRALGHTSVKTTQIYAEIVDRARMNPSKVLGGLLS
jgi:integrase/recombinase XerD